MTLAVTPSAPSRGPPTWSDRSRPTWRRSRRGSADWPSGPSSRRWSTIRPQRCRRRCGATARMALNTPVRFMSTVSDHPAASMSTIEPSVDTPALATRMSTDPSSATTPSTKAIMASRSRTSARADTHRRPRPRPAGPSRPGRRGWPAGRCTVARSAHRSTRAMSAPSRASPTAWLRPWPRAPPVITATRPANCPAPVVCLLRTAASPGSCGPTHGTGRSVAASLGGDPTGRAGRASPGPQHVAIAAVPLGVGRPQRRPGPRRRQQLGGQQRVGLEVTEHGGRQFEARGQVVRAPGGPASPARRPQRPGPAPPTRSRSHSPTASAAGSAVRRRRETWPGRGPRTGSGRRSRLSGRSHTPSRCSASRARVEPAAAGGPLLGRAPRGGHHHEVPPARPTAGCGRPGCPPVGPAARAVGRPAGSGRPRR